eukprot:gene5027-13433_t
MYSAFVRAKGAAAYANSAEEPPLKKKRGMYDNMPAPKVENAAAAAAQRSRERSSRKKVAPGSSGVRKARKNAKENEGVIVLADVKRFFRAAEDDDAETVAIILADQTAEAAAELCKEVDSFGWTPLMVAAAANASHSAMALLRHGGVAQLAAVDLGGRNALDIAIASVYSDGTISPGSVTATDDDGESCGDANNADNHTRRRSRAGAGAGAVAGASIVRATRENSP